MSFELVRNANVQVNPVWSDGHRAANIVVNDKYEHTFPSTSRVSRALNLVTADKLAERLSGGTYWFVDDVMEDFRESNYNGFVHDDSSIIQLMDQFDNQMVVDRDHDQIQIQNLKVGGNMKTAIQMAWSPFHRDVSMKLNLIRLICDNGAVVASAMISNKVPLMNRWEEHLNVAAKLTSQQYHTLLQDRVQYLTKHRSSVGQVQAVMKHIEQRAKSVENLGRQQYFESVMEVMDPFSNLGDVYRVSAMSDRHIAGQLESHLTAFDLYNLITEVRSHTAQTTRSTLNALDRMASSILFDFEASHLNQFKLSKPTQVFAGHEDAFIGRF